MVQQRSSSRHLEECSFLAGWNLWIHFPSETENCNPIRPANKARDLFDLVPMAAANLMVLPQAPRNDGV